VAKIISFLKSLRNSVRFKKIDYLLFGLIPGFYFCFESTRLYYDNSLTDITIPFWAVIILSLLSIFPLLIYIYFETCNSYKKKQLIIPAFSFLLTLLLLQGISVFFQNDNIVVSISINNNPSVNVITRFCFKTKFIHYISGIYYFLVIYIGILLLHIRVKNIRPLVFFVYLFDLAAVVLLIISLIKDDYGFYFSYLFSKELPPQINIQAYAPKCIFANKNNYGTFLEIGLLLSIINYAYTKHKANIVFGLLFYIHSVITLCKSAILLGTLCIFSLLLCLFVVSLRRKNKKSFLYSAIGLSCLITALITIVLLAIFNEAVKDKFDQFTRNIFTLSTRTTIWNVAWQIITQGSLFIGRGYGTYNTILGNSTAAIMEDHSVLAQTHNAFLGILGVGGFALFIPFIAIVMSSFYLAFKIARKNLRIGIVLFIVQLIGIMNILLESYAYLPIVGMTLITIQYKLEFCNSSDVSIR